MLMDMEIKFFAADVIGKKPKKVGDVFKAKFMGQTIKFKTISVHGDMYMAKIEAQQ